MLGNAKSVASAVLKVDAVKVEITEAVGQLITHELKGLCATSNPSILRKTSKEDLSQFSWNNVHAELKERAPIFLQFIHASVQNPSHSRNVLKKGDGLMPAMCDAACQLIAIYSEGMCATRRIKSVILKKGGLKKVGFKRLAPIYACMGYNSTSKMFENFVKDFDTKLLQWKSEVEEGVAKEKEILSVISGLEVAGSEDELKLETERLRHQTESMHPGYSFTGDNVDIMARPRQMMKKNQNKDHHMFQYVSYEARISPNHLPDDKPIGDIDNIPFTTFLPSAQEQETLAEQLTLLVCHQWAKYIPALSWFKEHVPGQLQHKHMADVKKKTNKVRFCCSFTSLPITGFSR